MFPVYQYFSHIEYSVGHNITSVITEEISGVWDARWKYIIIKREDLEDGFLYYLARIGINL